MCARIALVLTSLLVTASSPALAGFAGTDLFIPMAGRGVGAYPSNWFTTVYLYNPNATAVAVDLTFLERAKDNVAASPPKVTETLAPGETKVLANIVETTFGKTGTVYGALRIQSAEKVAATARVFSKDGADAPLTQSFGQDFAATPASFAIGLNESTEILGGYTTQPHQDSEARFNVGCVETTGAGSATVRWTARDAAGVERAHYDRTVQRLSQTQGAFHDYFVGLELTNARISASVIAGSGKVICYGSLITNDKTFPKPVQDPTTFEMVYPDTLLGAAAVQHDGTLSGDGTAGAPLGLAPGGVGITHLATTNSAPAAPGGDVTVQAAGGPAVLTASGGVLSWQPPAKGDITAVNAVMGLEGGGTSGDVTVAIANQGVIRDLIADGAVTDAKVASGIAYSKLSGAPTSLPPSGPAGGSLSGTYPNPGITDGAVTKGKLSAAGGTTGQVLSTDGSALQWQTPAVGDITAVNAGTGLTGGGTSGDVTLNVAVPLALSGYVSGSVISATNTKAHGTGVVYASGNLGVEAHGSEAAVLARGGAYGLTAWGDATAGLFTSVSTMTAVGHELSGLGVDARGRVAGGYFRDYDSTHSGEAYLGYGDRGIEAKGKEAGYFAQTDNWSYAYLAQGTIGIYARGNWQGGRFENGLDGSKASVGFNGYGIWATGPTAGGYFEDSTLPIPTLVATDTYKIKGIGSVAFMQNHPEDPQSVIVYNSPEGDEVATYTRGTARLVGGEARVPLGETFKWVTNPDLGLTAHLTPVGKWCNLFVAEKSTETLVVRSSDGGDCTFDYMVYGLRIGFEETTIVQEKKQEAYIPSMQNHRKRITQRPELARYTARSRFAEQRAAMGAPPADERGAQALLSAVHEFDPTVDRIESLQPPGAPAPPQTAMEPAPTGSPEQH